MMMNTFLSSYPDFHSASDRVLQFLHELMGFRLWMITRTEEDDWIVLNAEDHGYEVQTGDVFRWTDSFCSRMVAGMGPRIAPCSDEISAYAEAPIGRQVPIGAYVGVPLANQSGALFGTLCAIDPKPMPQEIEQHLPLVELLGQMLMTVLENELKAQQEFRRAERATAEAMIDELTKLFNRRGWERLVEKEDNRCQRYGTPACIIAVDLDDLKTVNDQRGHSEGDLMLKDAAAAILNAVRDSDVVARLGGDEFAVLAVDCDSAGAEAIVARIGLELAKAGVNASIGMSMRNATGSLREALSCADEQMYDAKRKRKKPNSNV
jgi:diguanylate cyclase